MAIPGMKMELSRDEEAFALRLLRMQKTVAEVEAEIQKLREMSANEAAAKYAYDTDMAQKAARAVAASNALQGGRENLKKISSTSDPRNGYFVMSNPNVEDNGTGLIKVRNPNFDTQSPSETKAAPLGLGADPYRKDGL